MKVLNGYDVDSGERVLTEVPEEAAAFWKEVKSSKSWRRYQDDFETDSDIVIGVLHKLYGDDEDQFYSVSQFIDALDVSMNSGELTRSSEEPEPAPIQRPLTRSGKPMTDSQIGWSEYTKFANDHSSQEVKNRARTDAGFASFVRTNLRREMNEQGVGDAATNLNDRPQSNDRVIPELARWVDEYRRMPAAEVRRRSRADYNPAGYEHFNKMLNLAASGGLI